MNKTEEYREYAVDCLSLLNKATDPDAKAKLLKIARAWHALASEAERNSRADVVAITTPILTEGNQEEP